MTMPDLPPEILPALDDPAFGGPGPYSRSPLADVCGHRINPDAIGWYKRRDALVLPTSGVKTCAHPELENWLGDVGSLDSRTTAKQPPRSEWPLTSIIPRMVVWGQDLAFPLKPGSFMIDYRYLHSNPHELPNRPWVNNIKDRFPDGSKLMLSFFNGRALALGLWTLTDFWYHPFLDNFDAIVLPEFSAYSDDPKPQSMIGERMMQIFASEGSEAGRTIIPTICWPTDESVRRQFDFWKSMYPAINTIHIDCYGSGVNRRKWVERWLWGLKKHCSNTPHIRWIITGIQAAGAVRWLNEIFPEGNYHLSPSVSMFVGATTKAGTDKEVHARRFYSKYQKLEELRNGKDVDRSWPFPLTCPSFSDVRLPAAQ
jgi:hypothetical protein